MTAIATAVKWIMFDFGGCLDSDGTHSRIIFFRAFLDRGLIGKADRAKFQDAYSEMDRRLTGDGLDDSYTLKRMNQVMCRMIAASLDLKETSLVDMTVDEITRIQAGYLRRNKSVIMALGDRFKLGIISNFCGNLGTVLKEFELYPLFDFVLDSFHAGYCKPDPRIFEQAIKLTGQQSDALCFVGDNPDRDIRPAHALGMKTILIHDGDCPADDGGADIRIRSLTEIADLTVLRGA